MKKINFIVTVFLMIFFLFVNLSLSETLKLKVLGQPTSTGLIQKNKEQPFFENFGKNTGLDIIAEYEPIDKTSIKSEETLVILKHGIFDIVSIRTAQASNDEPFLLGQDLVGLNPDYKTAKKVYDLYSPHFDARIKERYNSKLLGLWPFGPQVLFCKPEIKNLKDIKGKKVRVYDKNLAQFIEKLGAIPVLIPFAEVKQALALDICECAITGASSANTAGWPEETEYFMPIGFQIGFNGYVVSLDTWKRFTSEQQKKIQAAFDNLNKDIWQYSEELFNDALRCNVGKEPCNTVMKYNMKEVKVSQSDLDIVANAVTEISFPAWSKLCEQNMPGCRQKWQEILGPVVGIK